MKHVALVIPLAFAACSKPNDLANLQTSAGAIAKYYQPRAAELQQRMDHLDKASKLLANPQDREANSAALSDAATTLHDMVTNITSAQTKADALASAGKLEELDRAIQEESRSLAEDEDRVGDDLAIADAWLADQQRAPVAAPATGSAPAAP